MLRISLRIILLGSLLLSALSLAQFAQNPAVLALSNKTGAELTASLNRTLAQAATPSQITKRLEALIARDPTPWLAINAVKDAADMREIQIPSAVLARINAAYEADHGLLQTSGKCISCGWDAANCELSAILLCRVPVDLTPIGDISGVLRESGNYALGNEVDKIDLTLSAVGLGATALAPATGGSSLAIKLGASTLKTTKKIGNLSPGLSRILAKSADDAIDWKALSHANPLDYPEALRTAINPDALKPVTDTLKAAGDIRSQTSVIEALHLMKYVESAQDAAKTAQISAALGPRTVSAFEVVGKSRLFRATLRYTDAAIGAIIATIAAFLSALGLLFSSIVTQTTKIALKRTAPKPAQNGLSL